jgi:single-strand DNA-binding protein
MDLTATTIIGRIARDPHIIEKDGQQKLALFTVMVNRYWTDREGNKKSVGVPHPCQAWGKFADVVQSYCGKGKEVAIQAEFRNPDERDAQGNFVRNFPTFRVMNIQLGNDPMPEEVRELWRTKYGRGNKPAANATTAAQGMTLEQIEARLAELKTGQAQPTA